MTLYAVSIWTTIPGRDAIRRGVVSSAEKSEALRQAAAIAARLVLDFGHDNVELYEGPAISADGLLGRLDRDT